MINKLKENKEKERTNFLRVYSNLPIGVRTEIIAVIDKEPCTWQVCFFEIDNKTKMGDRMLDYLSKMKFI